MNQFRFFSKGLVLLFLFVSSFSQSQTIDTNYKTQINAKLAGLDKSKVPHKLLINQAMEFAELSDYSGSITSTNWATKGKFTSVYNTLLMSRVQTSVQGLVNPIIFSANWDNLRAPNRIVLSGLYYKYNKFRPDAYPNFLVNNNGVVTDKYINGVWQDPYSEQQVFTIATPILIYKSLSVQVTLPASLWYTNQASEVQSIAVDFGNGVGYQSMSLGQIRTINYANSGVFEWKYRLTLTSGQTLLGHSKLKIDVPVLDNPPTNPNASVQSTPQLQPNAGAVRGGIIVNPPVQNCAVIATIPFNGTRQYLGSANSATLQVKYLNNDCVIRKPLIVVEGFDSGLLGVENPFGENDYITFRRSVIFSGSFNLFSEMYFSKDIIYINFKNGRDDLKRNAYLVEDVINWVNAQKSASGSTTPNVVIGQSMGGVIARYALRDMEMIGQTHQTNLFLSHDAPQQGANIPVGVQYFARHMADQFIDTPLGDMQISTGQGSNIGIADIESLFNAQGTKQLLANYIDSNSNLNNSTFDAFQTELRNMGYPNQTRNIALSNGNHCANPQVFNPGDPLFSLNGGASTTALSTFLSTLLQPLTGIAFAYIAYEFNEPGLLIGLLPGSSSFSMEFSANALPVAGTTGQVYHGGIQYTKVLFDLFGWRPTIVATLTDRTYNNPVSLSYDYYPGGNYQLPFDFQNSALNNDFINASISAYLAPSFNFIPTPSALDIGGGATPLNNSDYLIKYTSATPPLFPKNSPFANFTTSFPNNANVNEPHISFNARNGNWLALELDNISTNNDNFNCTFICADVQIAGATHLCSTSTYSVQAGLPIYNWSITAGASLVTMQGNGTPNITLTAVPTESGQVTISVTYGDNFAKCGFTTITKNIWVGKPSFTFEYTYYDIQPAKSILCVTSGNPNFTLEQMGVTSVVFKNNGLGSPLNKMGLFCTRTTRPLCVEASVTNSCGTTAFKYECELFRIRQEEEIYTVFPNPSNDIVHIALKNDRQKPNDTAKISGQLYDLNGQKKSDVKIENNQASFSVRGLSKGIYVVKIKIDDKIENHQIAVQ